MTSDGNAPPIRDPELVDRVLRHVAEDVLVIDAAGRIRYVLAETARKLGAAPRALLGRSLREMVPSRALADHDRLFRTMAAEGGAVPGDLVLCRTDGVAVALSVVASPAPGDREETLLLGAPALVAFASVDRDRRDRGRELDALFALGAAVDGADGVDDLLGRLPAILCGALRFPGRACAAVRYRGRSFGDPSALALETALTFPIVVAGDERGVACVAYREALPFLDEERGVMRLAERILRKGLERHEFERGVLQAEKLASLGRLVAGVAHEINNPAQFLRGNLEILREALQDMLPLVSRCLEREPDHSGPRIARLDFGYFREQVGPLVDDMFEAVDRIRDLVVDLKRFARADAGRFDDDVDCNAVVEGALRVTRSAFRDGIAVDPSLAPSLPRVVGSARQLEQVIVNVLLNAVEALRGADRGGVAAAAGQNQGARGTVRVSTAVEHAPDRVVVLVRDDGPGIPPAVLERLFEPFFTTRQAQGGTGLGLSIAYGIVRAHGGTIQVESTLGRGTTVCVALPAARPAGVEPSRP